MLGLCVERSVEMIVGLLGIIKSGGVFLPLDPNYPKERILFMLEDADAGHLVTQEHILNGLPEYDGKAICLDSDAAEIAKKVGGNLGIQVNGDDLAYVIYTSGTTGTPKGVQVRQRNLINDAWDMKERYLIKEGDRMLSYISISFDASLEEIFPVLLSGGTIVVSKNPARTGRD